MPGRVGLVRHRFSPFALALLLVACGQLDGSGSRSPRDVESRLLAACCWVQTLDVHESPEASALRHEIEERLAHGDRADAIVDDLAARYGERIRAVPQAWSGLRAVLAIGVGLVMIASLALLVLGFRRKRAAAAPVAVEATEPHAPDAYDQRVDEELRRLDDA